MNNIYQRLNNVRKGLSYLQKDKKVSSGGEGYRGLSHDKLTGELRPLLVEHGIVVVPVLRSQETVAAGESQKGNTKWQTRSIYEVHFVNIDDPTDKCVAVVSGHGDDYGDKGAGKALSYAVKYAALKVLSLETGEDDEARVEDARKPRIRDHQVAELMEVCQRFGKDPGRVLARFAQAFYKLDSIEDLAAEDFEGAKAKLESSLSDAEAKKKESGGGQGT